MNNTKIRGIILKLFLIEIFQTKTKYQQCINHNSKQKSEKEKDILKNSCATCTNNVPFSLPSDTKFSFCLAFILNHTRKEYSMKEKLFCCYSFRKINIIRLRYSTTTTSVAEPFDFGAAPAPT